MSIRNVRRRWRLTFLLMLLGLTGCKGLFGSPGPPDDPLFLSKKPLEAKAKNSLPTAPPYSEPLPPSNPYGSQDQSEPGTRRVPQPRGPVPDAVISLPATAEFEEEEPE